jgi:PilZ domain
VSHATLLDQRSEPRLAPAPDSFAKLCILDGDKKSEPFQARVINLSGNGMRLGFDRKLAPGTLVRIDLDQTLLLGEVCYSEPDGNNFALGLRLEHSLLQTGSLERLRRRFAEEQVASPERAVR